LTWLERYLDTVEVLGSSPHVPTISFKSLRIRRSALPQDFNTDFNIQPQLGLETGLVLGLLVVPNCGQRFEGLPFCVKPNVTVMLQHSPSGQYGQFEPGFQA